MEVKHFCSTPCESTYLVGAEKVRLWAIVGGTLAIAFQDGRFSERKNYSEKFDSSIDPNWAAWKGPRTEDLEGGEATLIDFVQRNVPLRKLREDRMMEVKSILTSDKYCYRLRSKRLHDKEQRCYFYCELEIKDYVSPVTVTGKWYAGRCEDEIQKWASPRWKKLASVINPIWDKNHPSWENLSEEEYQSILQAMREFKGR